MSRKEVDSQNLPGYKVMSSSTRSLLALVPHFKNMQEDEVPIKIGGRELLFDALQPALTPDLVGRGELFEEIDTAWNVEESRKSIQQALFHVGGAFLCISLPDDFEAQRRFCATQRFVEDVLKEFLPNPSFGKDDSGYSFVPNWKAIWNLSKTDRIARAFAAQMVFLIMSSLAPHGGQPGNGQFFIGCCLHCRRLFAKTRSDQKFHSLSCKSMYSRKVKETPG